MNYKFTAEPFDNKRHIIKDFTCGNKTLDSYLKEKAGQEIKKNISAVYVLIEKNNPKIIGYFTLSSYSVALKDLPSELIKKLPKYQSIPAILIGRLAVDKSSQGKGIGEYLLMEALKRSYNLSKQIGSYAIIVDAKDENSKKFYEKYGFLPFLHKPLTLYLPMDTIKKLFIQSKPQ